MMHSRCFCGRQTWSVCNFNRNSCAKTFKLTFKWKVLTKKLKPKCFKFEIKKEALALFSSSPNAFFELQSKGKQDENREKATRNLAQLFARFQLLALIPEEHRREASREAVDSPQRSSSVNCFLGERRDFGWRASPRAGIVGKLEWLEHCNLVTL